ncbi:hypothetical protein C2G38_2063202 [Gigaspora rosea]|uniref:Uncharacterized protein n=1 Tax=Gigaspora rosea TaxID=44941 RepID=A0A397VZ01_9GLOM|nr:hypothetical protein C2G38_2063202 [Gigaspora rosea]
MELLTWVFGLSVGSSSFFFFFFLLQFCKSNNFFNSNDKIVIINYIESIILSFVLLMIFLIKFDHNG